MADTLDTFTRAYLEAALWLGYDQSSEERASSNDPSIDLRGEYDWDDLQSDTKARILEDCRAFQADAGARIDDQLDQAGHDFLLTRNGHGAGFWSRPEVYGGQAIANELTELAHPYGDFVLTLEADGTIGHSG